jgi:hypothetical protein
MTPSAVLIQTTDSASAFRSSIQNGRKPALPGVSRERRDACGIWGSGSPVQPAPVGDDLVPKHGSWLNIAEIELSALTRQCLDRRISDLGVLNTELTAWQNATNNDQRQVHWHFTTSDARTRLRHLYPEH